MFCWRSPFISALNYPKLEQLQNTEFSFKSVTTNSRDFFDPFDFRDDIKGKLEIDKMNFVIYYNDGRTKRILIPNKQHYTAEPKLYYSEFTAEELQLLEIPSEYKKL